MASKAKKSAKPSKKDLRKLADAQLTRKLDKTKRALAKEKDRAKKAAKKAKVQSKKDIAKAKKAAGNQVDSAKAATKKIKKSGPKSVAEVVAAVAATGSTKPDASWTIAALRARARETGVTGYSRLSKAALLERLK
jgi:hypothetical protein